MAIQCSLVSRFPTKVPASSARGQHLKRRGRHDGEEDNPADPDDEREQHEKTKEGHDGRIIVASSGRLSHSRVRQIG